jgi:hypothetical protein
MRVEMSIGQHHGEHSRIWEMRRAGSDSLSQKLMTARGPWNEETLIVFATCLLRVPGAVVLASPAAPGYHLIKKVPLGAAPGGGEYFDYVTVDSASRRVYLSHGAEIKVLDADHFSIVGAISGLKRCHGVLALPELGKGFITDGDAGSVAVFDLKTLKITGKIKNSRTRTPSSTTPRPNLSLPLMATARMRRP